MARCLECMTWWKLSRLAAVQLPDPRSLTERSNDGGRWCMHMYSYLTVPLAAIIQSAKHVICNRVLMHDFLSRAAGGALAYNHVG